MWTERSHHSCEARLTRAMSSCFFCLLLLAGCAGAQTVEGTIVNSVTGTGIPAVSVFLRPVSAEKGYSATTDALGHFLIKDVQAGLYEVNYATRDYLPSDLGPLPQVRVTVPTSVKLEGRMTPRPRISGRVVDANGDGVARATVEVIPLGTGSVLSDTAGNFELMLNQRGAYILSVVPPPDLKPPPADGDGTLVWARTFYPGVSRLESASRIIVSGEVVGITMKPVAVRAHAVRGMLLSPDGTPAAKAAIILDDGQRPGWQSQASAARTRTSADGVFEFPQVVDGEWRIESSAMKLLAAQWIEMTGREMEGVKLRLAGPFTVRGHVSGGSSPVVLLPHGRSIRSDIGRTWMLWPSLFVEPAVPPNAPGAKDAHDAFVEITTNEMREWGAVVATPDADGNFSLENIFPGRYRIVSLPPPPPNYLAAVRMGEADVTDTEVDLSAGAGPVTVVYKTDGASVRGSAEKCASGVVLLIPQDQAMQSLGFFRSARCDAGDRYELTGVRPGSYYALAFAGGGGIPALDDILISQAKQITVHADETASADLRAIPRPGY